MPTFNISKIKGAARSYDRAKNQATYGDPFVIGEAMKAILQLKFAEGRLYTGLGLSEMLRLVTGGSISLGVKYIPQESQVIMFNMKSHTRTVNDHEVKSLQTIGGLQANELGVAFYGPDLIDGVTKYTCCFVGRATFGEPSTTMEAMGQQIKFDTPVTTGEFMPDPANGKVLKEIAICDSEADADAWIDQVLGKGAAAAAHMQQVNTQAEETTA